MTKRKPVMVDRETHEALVRLAERHGISIKDIIAHFVTMGVKIRLLEPDWKSYLFESELEDYKRKLEEELRSKVETKKMDWKLRYKHDILMAYIKRLNDEEAKRFMEDIMADLKDPLFLEKLGEMELILLDGQRKLVKFEKGKPVLPVDPDKLMKCPKGWHVKHRWCKCDMWRECDLKAQEIAEAKVRGWKKRPKKSPYVT